MNKLLLIIFLSITASLSFAQMGTIRGTVIDDENGETLIGVSVIIEGTTNGAMTDLDGNYTLKVAPGTHNLVFSYISYATQKIEGVTINGGETKNYDIRLKTDAEEIGEVVVRAERITNSETALMTIQKKSANVIDGVSAELFKTTGDNTAAAAIKRVPGVSVEGGKYVYVRGLGDRYTKTILNGLTIPGLDPDKNTVQMDLFPSNLIDKIVVYKTFTPDLPGDFTGGMVDITTKSFPSRQTLDVNLGYSYNTGMHFNEDFILYEKGNLDWLGFAGKTRKLQFHENTKIPDETSNSPELEKLTRSFSNELGVKNDAFAFLNQNYGISYGNQFDKGEHKIGLNFSFNYANNNRYYDDMYIGSYFKDVDTTINELDKQQVVTGTRGVNEVLWSGLLGGAYKIRNHKIILSLLHSQSGEGNAAEYNAKDFDQTKATLYKNVIDYSQKSVTNVYLSGTHVLKDDKFNVEWKVSPTYSKILEPDVRNTSMSYNSATGLLELEQGDGAGIYRNFRYLDEVNVASKMDVTYNYRQWAAEKAKLKFGLDNTLKNRKYNILRYELTSNTNLSDIDSSFNQILREENIWSQTNHSGMYIKGNKNDDNEYNSLMNIGAVYAMTELPLTNKFKSIFGIRLEHAFINYKGTYQSTELDSMVYNNFAYMPSISLVYELIENMNLRTSYAKTVARPSFKEKSNARIEDPISQTFFIGNLDLEETDIHNVDLRWEYFFNRGEMISVSGFYKHFFNPIEMVPFETSPNNIQPQNISEAQVMGAELEFKKNFAFITEALRGLSIGANFTYIHSRVNTKEVIIDLNGQTEYELREEYARVGEEIDQFRQMQGQAPYIINTYLSYANDSVGKVGLEMNVSYNVQGDRLFLVGSGIVPDVYEDPFHSLNFKFSTKFGKEQQMKLSFTARNLIGDNFYQYFKSYKAEDQIFRSYSLGRSFGIGFSYKFF